MTQLFHFTLGPVQGFVTQARRTRDLWAGSFLLSWLTAQAMVEVRRKGGEIIFPVVSTDGNVSDPLIAAIENNPLENDPQPQIGSLPNRFKAKVPDGFDTRRVETVVSDAWRRLADAVWKQFIEPVANQGLGTRTIWDRQVAGFWEISWVQGESPDDHGDALWLEARKNWRNRWPESEGGDHCSLMGDLQELSGYNRALKRDQQDAFWETLRGGTGHLELHDNERLCAIALIKRLFPRLKPDVLKQTIGWVPGGKPAAIGNWPSTAYMAVIPWLREFVCDDTHRDRDALRRYEDEVVKAAGSAVRGERSTRISSLAPLGDLAGLDGNFFLPNALANVGDTPLQVEDHRNQLCDSLHALQRDHPAQPYYALLLLDGDSLGKHLSKGDPGKISVSLAKFSQGVADIVARHDGVTLYAGGDDVLALLTMDRALACASALNDAYGRAFGDPTFTASVAIVFAHYHLPLREVLAEAHRQLDKVAKEANGRDSLALAWFKASGKAAQWVATWTDAEGGKPVCDLQSLAKAVREGAFGSGFFYKLKARYPMLDLGEGALPMPTGIDLMLQAEYLKSRERKITLEQAEQAVRTLLHACRLSQRDAQGAFKAATGKLQLDGLRLARLLAGKEARE